MSHPEITLVSRTKYVALEVKAVKFSEENKKLRHENKRLRQCLRNVIARVDKTLLEVDEDYEPPRFKP